MQTNFAFHFLKAEMLTTIIHIANNEHERYIGWIKQFGPYSVHSGEQEHVSSAS